MRYRRPGLLLLASTLLLAAACSERDDRANGGGESLAEAATLATPGRTPAAEGASVAFVSPRDGDVVASPFRVEFTVSGMELVPAGTEAPFSGHHHILIDTGLPDLDLPVPADEHHLHFGDGSSSTELSLPPGRHTLQLLFADHLHIPHDRPVYSERITVTVE